MSEIHYATGRRKTSSARVYLSKGKGDITVNSKPLNEYFGRQVAQMLVMQPLKLTELDEKVNIKVMAITLMLTFSSNSVSFKGCMTSIWATCLPKYSFRGLLLTVISPFPLLR